MNMQLQVQEAQVSWEQPLGQSADLGHTQIRAWVVGGLQDVTTMVDEALGVADQVLREVPTLVLDGVANTEAKDQEARFVDASQAALRELQGQLVAAANLTVAILVAQAGCQPDSAELLAGAVVSRLAFAFAFRGIGELLLAPARKLDSVRLYIDDSGSKHIATTHSVEQGTFGLYILQYASIAFSSPRNVG